MKLEKTTTTGVQSALQTQATGDPKLDQLLADLRGATTLDGIGDSLRRIKDELPGQTARDVRGFFSGVGNALKTAFGSRPGGVRPLLAETNPTEVKMFCGEAAPKGARQVAEAIGVPIGNKDFKIFSTGDPFTFLGTPPDEKKGVKGHAENVKNKTVMIVQGDEGYTPANGAPKYDQATLVAEALQIAFAAKANGAKKAVLVLPSTLDPAQNPEAPFASLVARLASASGVDEVRYHASLVNRPADQAASGGVRAGLEVLGPKTREAEKWLATLGAAQDLDGISRALTQLDSAITGLKGKYDQQAQAFAQRVAEVLTERVNTLVPGLPKGAAGMQDGRAVVFAGQSNPDLSRDIATQMGGRLGSTAVSFEGSSPFAMIGSDVRGKPAVIVQTTKQDPYTAPEQKHSAMAMLTEALMLCDQAAKAGASDTTLVLPYMPSARSDKVDQKGVGAYASLVARWVDELKLGKVVLVEPHDVHVPAFFRTPVRVISGAAVLCDAAIADIGRNDLVLVRPDEGATKRTKQLAKDLDLPMVNGEKTRGDNNENATVGAMGNKSDVLGKKCLVTDDEIATGGTMRQTVARLKENGAAQVHVAVSHANMPESPEARHDAMRKLKEAGCDRLYLLDTQPVGKLPEDLVGFVKVVSIAASIAEEAK